jgi:hypothetical protein
MASGGGALNHPLQLVCLITYQRTTGHCRDWPDKPLYGKAASGHGWGCLEIEQNTGIFVKDFNSSLLSSSAASPEGLHVTWKVTKVIEALDAAAHCADPGRLPQAAPRPIPRPAITLDTST